MGLNLIKIDLLKLSKVYLNNNSTTLLHTAIT